MLSFKQFLHESPTSMKASLSKSKKPHSPCWVFQQPTIKPFNDLLRLYNAEMLSKKDPSYTIINALSAWVFGAWLDSASLKSKETIVKALLPIVACKGRADWMKWSGMCWRGLSRPNTVIKKSYKFTDEVKFMEGSQWIKATTKYKSKMPLQSWTTQRSTAADFSYTGLQRDRGKMPIMFEHMMLSSECLVSPAILKNIQQTQGTVYGKEHEVIRFSSKATTTTAWVNLTYLLYSDGSLEKVLGKIGIGKDLVKKLLADKKITPRDD